MFRTLFKDQTDVLLFPATRGSDDAGCVQRGFSAPLCLKASLQPLSQEMGAYARSQVSEEALRMVLQGDARMLRPGDGVALTKREKTPGFIVRSVLRYGQHSEIVLEGMRHGEERRAGNASVDCPVCFLG